MAREVLPHVPDAWVDERKTKIGYEISLNRYFYVYEPTGPLDEIQAELKELEAVAARLASRRNAATAMQAQKGLVASSINPMSPEKQSEFKSSNIECLGDVPAHWRVANIRRFAQMRTGHTPSRQPPEYWENPTIPWFTLADVWQLRTGRAKYLADTEEKISEEGLQNSAAELLPSGTVVLSRTASVGFSGIMPIPMATSQGFWSWICGPQLLPEYLLYLFRTMRPWLVGLTMGSTHKTIYQPTQPASRYLCRQSRNSERSSNTSIVRLPRLTQSSIGSPSLQRGCATIDPPF